MNILTTIHRASGINIHGRALTRTAVRAVILRGRDLLMVYSANVGDYKFPGGGVNDGETHEQALVRELLEECGAQLVRVNGGLGAVIEYDLPEERDFDVFKMTSNYYLCAVRDGVTNQSLEGYEAELGFQPVWVDIDKAIAENRSLLLATDPPEWLGREIFFLEYLRESLLQQTQ